MTDLAGFDQTKGEEWKIMGLAPYGRRDPELFALLRRLYRIEGRPARLRGRGDGSRRRSRRSRRAARPTLDEQGWADLARCGQDAFEEMMDVLLGETASFGLSKNLVLAGGCALNSSYNGKILGRSSFERLHVPSAPADDGNAIGAAWLAHAEDHPDWRPQPRVHDAVSRLHGLDRTARAHDGLGAAPKAPRPRQGDRSRPRTSSRTESSSAGSRGGPSSARGRSATARSSPTRARPTPRTSSTPR